MLGDKENETLECAEDLEHKIKKEFVVGVDQDVDTSATDSSYDIDPRDEVTLYIDEELIYELGEIGEELDTLKTGCELYEEYALDEIDDTLKEVCEWGKAKRYFRHRPSWRRRYRTRYWRSRSK